MKHPQFEEMIPFYVARTLPLADAQALERHLATCAACRQSLREWRLIAAATWEEVDALVNDVPPLAVDVRADARARLGAQNGFNRDLTTPIPVARHLRSPKAGRGRGGRRAFYSASTVAAALVMVALGGLLLLMFSRSARPVDDALTPVPIGSPYASGIDDDFAAPSNFSIPSDIRGDLGIVSPVEEGGASSARIEVLTPTQISTPFTLIATPTLSIPATDVGIPECFVTPTNRQAINVYQWPGREQSIVGQMAGDEILRVYVTDGQGWYNVIRLGEGILGWVSGEDVMLQGFCDALWLPTPTIPPPTPTPLPLTGAIGIVNGRWTHTTTVIEHGCGGQSGQVSTMSITINTSDGENQLTLTYDNGFSIPPITGTRPSFR
jgi:hypothetical protein